MGMYDTLGDGDQVKVFYIPVFYYSRDSKPGDIGSGSLGFMGGNLRYFGKGDEVPYKTWWYKYPKNFLIMDVDPYWNYVTVHKIEDGKYMDSFDGIERLPGSLFGEEIACFDYTGNKILNIKDLTSFKEYVSNVFQYNRKIEDTIRKYSSTRAEFFNYIKESKDGELDNVEYEEKKLEYQMAQEEEHEELSRMQAEYLGKYRMEEDENNLLGRFGGYLECIRKKEERGLNDDGGALEALKKDFASFMGRENISVDQFFEWNETEDTDREIIQKIIRELE